MEFLTNEKLVIVGAGGMIGASMVQNAIMMGLTPNICAYDIEPKQLEGMAEEIYHSAFKGVNLFWTTDAKKAFSGARYVISSGGAPRKENMTREDLLAENAKAAKELGINIQSFCPDLKMCIVVFNPADITGLVTLIYSGLAPTHLCTLAALDSTRLKSELAKELDLPQDEIKLPRTYGGHGEQMAVFSNKTTVGGTPLKDLIGTPQLSKEKWEDIKKKVIGGGKRIIDLRGRSSFQSPAYLSVSMMRAAMGGDAFTYPVGCYVNTSVFQHIIMAMETTLDKTGVHFTIPSGSREEMEALETSYKHLCIMRDEIISMNIIPEINNWKNLNVHLN